MSKVLVPDHIAREVEEEKTEPVEPTNPEIEEAYVQTDERVLDPTLLDKSFVERMFALKNAKSKAICIEQTNNAQDIKTMLQKDILKNGKGTFWQDRLTKSRTSPIRIEIGDPEKIFDDLLTNKCGLI